MVAVMLLSAATAAWCSLLLLLAALNKLRWLSAAQRRNTLNMHYDGRSNKDVAASSSVAILWGGRQYIQGSTI
jgi:hypothetical protein